MKPGTGRRSHWRCSVKKMFWKFWKFQRKALVLESHFLKVANLRTCNFIKKKIPTQVLSREICKFFKNICERLFQNFIRKVTPTQMLSWEFCEFFQNTNFVGSVQMAGSEIPVSGLTLIKFKAWSSECL